MCKRKNIKPNFLSPLAPHTEADYLLFALSSHTNTWICIHFEPLWRHWAAFVSIQLLHRDNYSSRSSNKYGRIRYLSDHFIVGVPKMSAGQKHTVELSSEKDPGRSKKAPKWQVTKSTFEKWQREHEQQYSILSWLGSELDRDKVHVVPLSCAACKKYEPYLVSLKNISKAWISSSTNLKVSNLLDHATSKVHKVAMTRMRVDHAKVRGKSPVMSSIIGHYLSTIHEGIQA